MVGSITQPGEPDGGSPTVSGAGGRWPLAVGLAIAALALVVYISSNPARHNFYEHFTWQASAWLEGQVGIRFPVAAADGQPYNDYFLDVMPILDAGGAPTGRALIPFPPLPAVLLVPFVAVWGLATNVQLLAAVLGGLAVWLAWWMLGRLPLRLPVRAAVTIWFAFGTVFWYASVLGTTWYFAHVVAVGLTLAAVGVALGADPDGGRDAVSDTSGARAGQAPPGRRSRLAMMAPRIGTLDIDRRQFVAGFLLGLASTARLTVLFGAPFLVLVGGGGSWARRGLSAGLGAAIPVLALVTYNVLSAGHLFHPAYEFLYRMEAAGYPTLGYHRDWAIEDLRYVPQNLAIMLGSLPDIMPACPAGVVRGAFSEACPFAVPQPIGMSLLLTSPAYLLALPALRRFGADRLTAGAAVAVGLIAAANLMHFSQGWVQFGYRFSNDFVPFGLVLVALGLSRRGRVGRLAWLLIAVSIAVNLWGVTWRQVLNW